MAMAALAFHAEKLHDDLIWRRVERASRWMAARGLLATFFVYPYRAQVAGKDLDHRVQALAALGHEIGQHTHSYSGQRIDKPDKVNDLSERNVAACLRRDFQLLSEVIAPPKGSTAGAWLVTPTVLDALVELGFEYDCSARFPKLGGGKDESNHRWWREPQIYRKGEGKVICLPTTCSLGEWFKRGRKVETGGPVGYQLIYLHDYDLRALRVYLLFRLFLAARSRGGLISVEMLAREFLPTHG